MGEQSVPAAGVNDPAAATVTTCAARHFPRFEQLLAWQRSDTADDAPDAIEQRLAGKPIQIVVSEPVPGSVGKRHVCHDWR